MAQPATTQPSLAITACDTYEGQLLAYKLAEYLEEHSSDNSVKEKQLLCLARDPEMTGRLKTKSNCKIIQVSYDDPTSIAIAIRGIQTVVLVPEIEDQRVDWANRVVDIMAQEKVARCILISSIGTDATEKEHLDRFVRIEENVKGSIERWTILRYLKLPLAPAPAYKLFSIDYSSPAVDMNSHWI